MESVIDSVDILEVFNARGRFRGKAQQAADFAQQHSIAAAASSDAHCQRGLGYTYSILTDFPDSTSLKDMLAKGSLHKMYAPFYTYFCPFVNRIKNKIILSTD